MNGPMQRALGADWDKLPPALQAHHRFDTAMDAGRLDIAYPRFMQPWLSVLRRLGALVDRIGSGVPTLVAKRAAGERQHWRRTIEFDDGRIIRFDSVWVPAGGNRIIEYVNPVLGLEMAVHVEAGRLHYRGVRFVARLGPLTLTIPEWLALGHTTIVECARGERRFAMDFRLTHPLFGEVFRYSGEFEADCRRERSRDAPAMAAATSV